MHDALHYVVGLPIQNLQDVRCQRNVGMRAFGRGLVQSKVAH